MCAVLWGGGGGGLAHGHERAFHTLHFDLLVTFLLPLLPLLLLLLLLLLRILVPLLRLQTPPGANARAAMDRYAPSLAQAVGPVAPELLQLLVDPPAGSTALLLCMVTALSEGLPPQQLVKAAEQHYQQSGAWAGRCPIRGCLTASCGWPAAPPVATGSCLCPCILCLCECRATAATSSTSNLQNVHVLVTQRHD
jgi:hypothetical protein